MHLPRNVVAISLGFFFIFFGFGTAQQYLVILFNQQGRGSLALVSLCILYLTFLITGIFVSKLIPLVGGLKRALMIGAGTYALFVASVAINSTLLLLAASLLIGAGAGLLWVSSGQLITDSDSGAKAGRNLAFQTVAQYSGNILGIFAGRFFASTLSLPQMYGILALITAIGMLCILFVRPIQEELKARPFKPLFIFDARMLALFPLVFGAYFLQGQTFTAMSMLVVTLVGIGAIPVVVSILKVSNITGSFSSGVLSERVGKRKLLTVLVGTALAGILIFTSAHTFVPILAGALLLGFSMAAIYPVTVSFLKETMPESDFLYALGTFHVYTNAGVLCAVATNLLLPAGLSFIPGGVALLVALPALWLYDPRTRATIAA